MTICNQTWKNQYYVHIKFESLKCKNFLSAISIVCKMSSYNYAESHKEFNKDNRFWIAHRIAIGDTYHNTNKCIFCVDNTFSRPSHIWEVADGSVPSPAEYMITL